MADSIAYTYKIDPYKDPNGNKSSDEEDLVHQSSPSWVLTFVRWENRDTFRVKDTPFSEVRDPLIVENDCIQVSVSVNKASHTPSMTATLVMSDVNYETAIHPGDFVFVNMLNWQEKSREVADKVRANKSINGPEDGFKGVFKVQGVRRILITDPNTGAKIVLFKINGFAFTELNNVIYFNPFMLDPNQDPKNQILFASQIGKDWSHIVTDKAETSSQNIIAYLLQSFIGTGISDEGRNDKFGTVKSPNIHYFIPGLVGTLLGVSGAKAAKDIYDCIFGVQSYASGAAQSLSSGMNPSGLSIKFGRIYYTKTPCEGESLLKPEYWNQVKTWAIINQFTNSPLNEIYTCFRISKNNKVMPTIIYRQIPFSSEVCKETPITRFLNLPRWKINPSMVFELDIGREESARVNFVQYFGKTTVSDKGTHMSLQIGQTNYSYDPEDIKRSGLRPYVITSNFDELTPNKTSIRSKAWANIMSDALIGGHLKLNGTIQCVGIVEPIAVGDNLEFDDVVYHIEQVSHNCSIDVQTGKRTFRTQISLSSGVSVSSSVKGTRYAEMTNENAYKLRESDYEDIQILPGVSESQDIKKRPNSVDGKRTDNKPFPQPEGIPGLTKKKK